ncbi:MAG: putative membrane protein, partial [Flavobacterium sp.]
MLHLLKKLKQHTRFIKQTKKMKKLILGLAIISSVFTGCTSSDDEVPVIVPVTGEITGNISANTTYAFGTYTLKGIVKIQSGVTVTFAAGSTITCNKVTGDNALVVLNGGKLVVNGTETQPVVFTEVSQIPGSWGGIIIYGDAPIKAVGGLTTSTSEDGNALPYGGTNATHNGGSLAYARVEYAGSKLADGTKENNGFTFYSVGSGTTLDHLVSYKGADDGFEFFGGTVSMTNAISYGNYDDAFDWQDGWQGQNNTNWYGYQVTKGNFGMEIEASNINNTFFPKVANVTLKRAAGCVPEVAGDVQVDAFQFKKEGNGEFSNVVIDGYGVYTEAGTLYNGASVKIQDATTNNNQVNDSKIKLTNVKVTNTTQATPIGATSAITVVFPAGQFTTSTTATGATLTQGNWATVGGVNLLQ